mgnify:CR=1 FL=1
MILWGLIMGGGDGLTLVMKDEKSGYVNKNGEVIIPIEYDELSSFNEGIAVAKTGDKVQFIDCRGVGDKERL